MTQETNPYSPALSPKRRVRIPHLAEWKARGERWSMLTAYDIYTASIFDEAGIPVLLVGDSASNNVLGNATSLAITVDELIPLVRAVSGAARRSLVLADLPFGSYEASPEQAFATAVRFMKEGGAHAVKLEGGVEMLPQVQMLSRRGIPVMAHIGFTPQSEHALGGYRVQGRGEHAETLVKLAKAFETAGAFGLLLEMIPGPVAADITRQVSVPTVGIGAGGECDAQVLVWQDMAGMRTGNLPRFVKQYANLHVELSRAAEQFAVDVARGNFPGPEHTFS